MAQNLTGLKVRSKRKLAGLTQGELARRAGISPSYLHLIEQSKRPIAGKLIDRIAQGLGVDRAELDGEAERRIVQSLNEVAADPAIAGSADRPGPAEELVGRSPGWASLVLRLYQALQDRNDAVLALADRLNRDPFLGVSVHRVLTDVTSIHSAAEILENSADLTPAERQRFLSIVSSGSAKLSQTAQALAGFFESAHTRIRSATPMEHVDAFLFQTGNYFPELEDAAAGFLSKRDRYQSLENQAAAILGEFRAAPAEGHGAAPYLAAGSRFSLLKRAAGRIAGDVAERIVRDHPALGSEEARSLAAAALHAYTAAAILMPYEPFIEAAERCRYDLDRLAGMFGASYEQVAHRLATLRRPGAEGVRFAFMRSDPSGYITKRLPLPRLPLPRYGNACPMWVIYSAFQTPGITVRSFGELMSGDQFLFFARAIEKRPHPVGRPRHLLSVMLVCQAGEAGRVVYGDGLDWRSGRAIVPLGTTCRLCRREACGHRQEARLMPG